MIKRSYNKCTETKGFIKSTPKAHNAIFAASVIQAVEDYNPFWKISAEKKKETVLAIINASVGFYNYPDAFQAAQRQPRKVVGRRSSTSGMIGRAVSHFECAKDPNKEPNWHTPFTPEALKLITAEDSVEYYSTEDQVGDFMGQLTDADAIVQAFASFEVAGATNQERLMAKMVKLHLFGADRFNDFLFRQLLEQKKDGSIFLNGKKLSKEDFTQIKNLIMNAQEQASCMHLTTALKSLPGLSFDKLNDAIRSSYRQVFSPWMAENTLKYVKDVEPCEALPSYKSLGLSKDKFAEQIHAFVTRSIDFTSENLSSCFYANSHDLTMKLFK